MNDKIEQLKQYFLFEELRMANGIAEYKAQCNRKDAHYSDFFALANAVRALHQFKVFSSSVLRILDDSSSNTD